MPRKRKYTVEIVKSLLEEQGYMLLSDEVYNEDKKIEVECPKGHRSRIYFSNFYTHGHRCLECSGSKKYTIEFIREYCLERGYTLVSTEYFRAKEKLEMICPKGHHYVVSWRQFLHRGFRCSACSGKGPQGNRRSIEHAREVFEAAGLTLVGTEYVSAVDPLEFICGKGHHHKMSLSNLKKGQQCGKCVLHRYDLEEVRKLFKDLANFELLVTKYTSTDDPLAFRCENGHEHKLCIDALLAGIRCAKCVNWGTSRAEEEIVQYFEDKGVSFIHQDRTLIAPLELDLYFLEHKVAVEYCGIYWHSENGGHKSRKYHYNKMMRCREQGVRLLTVFEDEYKERPQAVLSRIESALNLPEKRLYGRKCTVSPIDKGMAKEFLAKYHLQGSSPTKVAFGLFSGDILVGVMTGGGLSRRHVTKAKCLELKRLAFLPGYSVAGGASKLFKRLREYSVSEGFSEVRSYCDMRYGKFDTPVYEKLGFTLFAETKYTPHYLKNGKRIRNQSLAKTPEERLTGKTEWELRQEQGYDRIWDCGHRTYILELGEIS